jgi:WD40 repeat protein
MAVAWFGAHLLSAGEDGTLRTWEVTSGNPLIHKAAVHSAPMSAMAVSAQHDLILTGADDCKAVLHTLPGDTRRLPAVL